MLVYIEHNGTVSSHYWLYWYSKIWRKVICFDMHGLSCFTNNYFTSNVLVIYSCLREQVQLFIARKVSQREHQTLQEEERKKQLQTQKQKVNVGRDPERLLRHTATWHERCKQEDKKSTVNRTVPVLHLRNMPHL